VLEAYPDARFVWCHRDPAAVFASLCELIAEVRLMGSDQVDREEIGAEQLRAWGIANDRALDARARLGDDRFVDVWHQDTITDPVAALAGVYDRLGWKLTDAAERAARDWLAGHDRTAYGEHRPALADYGLDRGRVRDRLAAYCERFGV
jgi:Sulfotransferase family